MWRERTVPVRTDVQPSAGDTGTRTGKPPDSSKIEAGALTFEAVVFDPTALLHAARDMLEHSARQKGLTLKLDIQGKLPQAVSGDPTRLRQVLVNLAGNAVKFTEHGSVTIAAKTVQQDENGVTIAFAVADTGIGIRDEDQARIFEPFEQADSSVTRKYGGAGLGLVIVRRIVETASRGTHKLTLESREGIGSTFRFAMDFALAEPVSAGAQLLGGVCAAASGAWPSRERACAAA
ncbi:ATP-binding protein [Butyricicoccus sp.]